MGVKAGLRLLCRSILNQRYLDMVPIAFTELVNCLKGQKSEAADDKNALKIDAYQWINKNMQLSFNNVF